MSNDKKIETDIKRIAKYKSIFNIGNYEMTIFSDDNNLILPNNEIPINKDLPIIKINIYITNQQRFRDAFFTTMENNKMHKRVPNELIEFYKNINKYFSYQHEPNKYNTYYQYNDNVYAYFSYATDNFCLKYSYTDNDIYIVGSMSNLNRVLLDLITVSRKTLPIHASAVSYKDKTIGILCESGKGKTSLLIKLLEKGFGFISDDVLFVEEDTAYRVSNTISFRKKYPNNKYLEEIAKQYDNEKINIDLKQHADNLNFKLSNNASNFMLYIISDSEYIDVRDMRQPYPCIAHESFWAMRFFNMRDSSKLIKDSFQYLSNLVKTCECIQVDFQNTDIVPSKILKKR